MAKPRAQGADVVMLIAKETTYGTAVSGAGGGVYRRMPMRSDDVSAAQGLEDDDTINLGTPEDGDPSLGAFNVSGDLVLPMDVRGMGVALTMALGASSVEETVADELWTHTWTSGQDLFSYTKQVGHPKLSTPKWRTQLGCKSNGFNFSMARNGRALLTMPIIAAQEVKDVSGARDASPLIYPYLPFDNCTGSIKVDDAQLASVTGLQFNFSNGLEAVESIREDNAIDGADETMRRANGTANLRFGASSTIEDLVDGKTPCELKLGFRLLSNTDWTLTFTLHRVFFERTKRSVTGPGGIEQATSWRAARDATAGCMMTVALSNDVEAYA